MCCVCPRCRSLSHWKSRFSRTGARPPALCGSSVPANSGQSAPAAPREHGDVPTSEGGCGGTRGLHTWGFGGDTPPGHQPRRRRGRRLGKGPPPPPSISSAKQKWERISGKLNDGTEQRVPYLRETILENKNRSANCRLPGRPADRAGQPRRGQGAAPQLGCGPPGVRAALGFTFPDVENEIPWLTHDTHGSLFWYAFKLNFYISSKSSGS